MFKVIGEILTENIISKHVLLNKSEFLKSNPVCKYEHLKWKYLENPNGESFGINGYHNRELTSKIAYQKKIFHYKNKTLAGANLCDLIINKKFRNIDVFLQLTNQFFIKKDITRSELSIMVPNEISINLYKKLLKLNSVGSFELRFMPIITSILFNKSKLKLLKVITNLKLKILNLVNTFFQNLLNCSFSSKKPYKKDYKIMIKKYYTNEVIQGDRSWEWFKWRYSSDSKIKYFVESIYFKRQLIGYFSYRKIKKFGFDIILILEIVLIKKNFLIDLIIFLKLVEISSKFICDFFITIRTFQRLNPLNNLILFPIIPKFLFPNPIELFVIHKDKYNKEIMNINNWKINMADLDIF